MTKEYHSIILDADSDSNLEDILKLAMSMASYHRIYIEDLPDMNFDENEYRVEVLFGNEHDATLFHLKLV